MRLTSWEPAHLGCVPLATLLLPPAPGGHVLDSTGLLLGNSSFRQRSGARLAALHGLPTAAVAAGQLAGWDALTELSLVPDAEHRGMQPAAFPPSAFPPGLRRLELRVPRFPFRLPGSLPGALDALTLRSGADQDLILHGQLLGEAAAPARWRRLEVHAGRTVGLVLDDLAALGACATELVLAAPNVMLSTSDPAHPAALAAPPLRSLDRLLGQYLAVLAPVLAAAGLVHLRLVAGEASFYCRMPGRRAILDAASLPPAGRASAAADGAVAVLDWPAVGSELACPAFCLSITPAAK